MPKCSGIKTTGKIGPCGSPVKNQGDFCYHHKDQDPNYKASAAQVPRSSPLLPSKPKAKTPSHSPPKTPPRSPLPAGPSGRVSSPRSPKVKTPPRSPLPAGPSGRRSPVLSTEQALERKPIPFNVWEQEPEDRKNTIRAIKRLPEVVYKTIMNKVEKQHFDFMSTRASVLLARDGQVPEHAKHGDIILYGDRFFRMAQMDNKGKLQIVKIYETLEPREVRPSDIGQHIALICIQISLELVEEFHPFYWNVEFPILNWAEDETSHYTTVRMISQIPFEYFKNMHITSDIYYDKIFMMYKCFDMYRVRIILSSITYADREAIVNNSKFIYDNLDYVYTNQIHCVNRSPIKNEKSNVCKTYYLIDAVVPDKLLPKKPRKNIFW